MKSGEEPRCSRIKPGEELRCGRIKSGIAG
jgi:hypothetical protein